MAIKPNYKLTDEQNAIINAAISKQYPWLAIKAVAGSSKAIPNSEPVLTPNGWIPNGSLQPNDYVIGSSGNPIKVLSVHPQGVKDIYKVSFRDGTYVNCTLDHLWTVRNRKGSAGKWDTLQLKDILNRKWKSTRYDKRYGTTTTVCNYFIPAQPKCEYSTNVKLPIHPYLLGVLLGDGGLTNRSDVRLTLGVKKYHIINKIIPMLKSIDCKLQLVEETNTFTTFSIRPVTKWAKNNLITILKDLSLWGHKSIDKFIPSMYLHSNSENRQQLLSGLLDTDGTKVTKYKRGNFTPFSFSSSSKRLIYDAFNLAKSLGYALNPIGDSIPSYTYKGNKLNGHKHYTFNQRTGKTKDIAIVDIQKVTKEEATCIKVDSSDSLYITNGYNLTHNTTTSVETARQIKQLDPTQTIRVIIFGKEAADESKLIYAHTAQVSTVHSMAYQAIVKSHKLKSIKPFLTYKDIPYSYKTKFGYSSETLQFIESFCNQPSSLDDYILEKEDLYSQTKLDYPLLTKYAKDLLAMMYSGTMSCTHSFYLKLFHTYVMDGSYTLPPVNYLIVDEAQDLSEIVLDIVQVWKADVKILLGDNNQSIFTFMNLQNGFDRFSSKSHDLHLTKSFRVSSHIAPRIEQFMRRYLDPNAVFIGHDYGPNPTIRTIGHLTRNNATMVARMIEFTRVGKPYRLTSTTKVNALFNLPLFILGLKPNNPPKDKSLLQLYHDYEDWNKQPQSRKAEQSARSYIYANNKDYPGLKSTMNLLASHTPAEIFEAQRTCKSHINLHIGTLLSTVHSSKGSTLDEVTIDKDMNDSIQSILDKKSPQQIANYDYTAEEISEFRLYYVAASRCRYRLNNAIHI